MLTPDDLMGIILTEAVEPDPLSAAIKKRFVIVHEPGKEPFARSPPSDYRAAVEFLREVIARNPNAQVIFAQLTWNDELWCEGGKGVLSMHDHVESDTDTY